MSTSPYAAYNRRRNINKAIENLWGLCRGLTADRQLKPLEVEFLHIWLNDNESLQKNPDAFDLFDCAKSILADGVYTPEHESDLSALIEDVLEYRSKRADQSASSGINILLGILQGLMADRELNDREILQLRDWIKRNDSWRREWPGNALYRRLEAVLKDGIITEKERMGLVSLIDQVCNTNILETGSAAPLTITLGAEEVDHLQVDGAVFCFTGTFLFGPRKACESAVIERGGSCAKNPTQGTDYLVLGTRVSADWIHTSFGRKIEKVRYNQSQGANTVIITEKTWVRHLEKS